MKNLVFLKFLLSFASIFVLPPVAKAMDAFEIQVYDAEINRPEKLTLETHLNNVISSGDPEYQGQISSQHLTHLTFEVGLGLKPWWELGAYLQTAIAANNQVKYAGVKLRSKFVVPRADAGNWHLGCNFEFSNVPHDFEQNPYAVEVRPILGYQEGRIIFLVNPILGSDLSQNSDATPAFAPSSKIAFDTRQGFNLGFEYYSDLGSLAKIDSLKNAIQYLFAAFDLTNGPIELNIGIGQGLTSNSNPYVAKAILGFEF